MKSLIEEASSVSKAIEKVWIRAGKPNTFSIKIYEEAEKNFFGLTTKSAKVGIIFDEKTRTVQPDKPSTAPAQPQQKRDRRPQEQKPRSSTSSHTTPKPREPRDTTARVTSDTSRIPSEPIISEDMKQVMSAWIKDTLHYMQLPDTSFTLDVSDQLVRVSFDAPLMTDTGRERMILRSMSYLLIATLRNRFKKNLRGLKVIFTRA